MKGKAYKAIELFSHKKNDFLCPYCSDIFYFQANKKVDSTILGRCSECNASLNIELPKLTKKLVYLDQWFVSNLFDDNKREQFEKLIKKLENLISLQQLAVIVSSVHVEEIANIALADKQKLIWNKFNSLSNGIITKNRLDIYVSQSKRSIMEEKENFPWSDILVKNPHEWALGKYFLNGINVQLLFTNLEKVKLQEILSPSTEDLNKWMKEIIHNQYNSIGLSSTENECFEYVKNLWHLDLQDAISYYRKVNKIPEKSTNESDSSLSKHGSEIYSVIRSIVDACRSSSKEVSVNDILIRLNEKNKLTKSSTLRLALEALRLHSALQSIKQNGCLTKNKKKFSVYNGFC